ncbi:MAG: YebC/PmpR family DNA-binding transcriptional regulator [Lachnospiraceae bacterium]|nr:YebC/PmpR family DNA-binding transcriptional regulator [Lachnospiraceae bacterium]
MSGHSKFANIKHKKEKADAQKGKAFTKLGRELVVAIKEGGPDPVSNSKLRDVIAKCKAANMPNDTIQRSIKKAAGEQDVDYEEIIYEGYGPAGIAILVECLTENHNRTAADVRYAFNRNGGNMGTSGCVSFMFDKKGQIIINAEGKDEDELMDAVLEAGADDVTIEDGIAEVLTEQGSYNAVYEALEEAGYEITEGSVCWIPQNTVANDDPEVEATMEKLIDALEDLDDVQNVYHNWD